MMSSPSTSFVVARASSAPGGHEPNENSNSHNMSHCLQPIAVNSSMAALDYESTLHLIALLRQLVDFTVSAPSTLDDDTELAACQLWDACADPSSAAFLIERGLAQLLRALLQLPLDRLHEIGVGIVANLCTVLQRDSMMQLLESANASSESTLSMCLSLAFRSDDPETLVQVCRLVQTSSMLCSQSRLYREPVYEQWSAHLTSDLLVRLSLIASNSLHGDLMTVAPDAMYAMLHNCPHVRANLNATCACFSESDSAESKCSVKCVVAQLIGVLAQSQPAVNSLKKCLRILEFATLPAESDTEDSMSAFREHAISDALILPSIARLMADEDYEQIRASLCGLLSNFFAPEIELEIRRDRANQLLSVPDFLAGLCAMPPRSQLQDFALILTSLLDPSLIVAHKASFAANLTSIITHSNALMSDCVDGEAEGADDEDDKLAIKTIIVLVSRLQRQLAI